MPRVHVLLIIAIFAFLLFFAIATGMSEGKNSPEDNWSLTFVCVEGHQPLPYKRCENQEIIVYRFDSGAVGYHFKKD